MSAPTIVQRTHQGSLFAVEILEYRTPDGRAHQREIVRHPGAVLVLPILRIGKQRRIVMIRNYRVAVDERLWELPAGKLEKGEQAEAAAARELEEEAGYSTGRIVKLGEFFTSPGFADELMHVFIAEDLTPCGQRLEPGEQIDVSLVDEEEAVEMALDGRLCDGKSIAAILMWDAQLNRSRDSDDCGIHQP